jgi:hypothetical protein
MVLNLGERSSALNELQSFLGQFLLFAYPKKSESKTKVQHLAINIKLTQRSKRKTCPYVGINDLLAMIVTIQLVKTNVQDRVDFSIQSNSSIGYPSMPICSNHNRYGLLQNINVVAMHRMSGWWWKGKKAPCFVDCSEKICSHNPSMGAVNTGRRYFVTKTK